jgi:6-phosphogluconolactonase
MMIPLSCVRRLDDAIVFTLAILISGLAPNHSAFAQDSTDQPAAAQSCVLVYVGGYKRGGNEGIYAYRLQAEGQNIALAPLGLMAETENPSFLALDVERNRLFAVNEVDEHEGQATGYVSAYSINPADGKLTLLNRQPSMGAAPCHIVLDATGRNVIVANYNGGNVAVLPVGEDGKLGAATSVHQHEGSSVNRGRQSGPHAHCVTFSPDQKFAFVCDLGLDKVMAYRFDAEAGTLTPHDPAFATVPPGSGPRHMAFRLDGKFAYVINEMTSTITEFAYDAAGRTRRTRRQPPRWRPPPER